MHSKVDYTFMDRRLEQLFSEDGEIHTLTQQEVAELLLESRREDNE